MGHKIGIIFLTYARTDYAVRTIQSMRCHTWPEDLMWFIADDGSDASHVRSLIEALKGTNLIGYHSERHSYGRSANVAYSLMSRHTDFTFWLEDDWELQQDLDLNPYAEFLDQRDSFGMVRLGYLNVNMKGTSFGHNGQVYWHLDRDADPYVFTGHPSLRHRRFMDAYGPYPEGLRPGETELEFAYRFRTRPGPHIVWPANIGQWGPFGHIGQHQSYT